MILLLLFILTSSFSLFFNEFKTAENSTLFNPIRRRDPINNLHLLEGDIQSDIGDGWCHKRRAQRERERLIRTRCL